MSKDAAGLGESETGPLWNHFWNAALSDPQEFMSGGESEDGMTPAGSMDFSPMMASPAVALPVLSPSVGPRVGLPTSAPPPSLPTPSFAFKLWNTSSGQVFRFSLPEDASFDALLSTVSDRTRLSVSSTTPAFDRIPQKTLREPSSGQDLCLGFFDEDGDGILLASDQDLTEALSMAKQHQWPRLEVFLGQSLEAMEDFRGRRRRGTRLVGRLFPAGEGVGVAVTLGVCVLAVGVTATIVLKQLMRL
jgi:hypothetical protein